MIRPKDSVKRNSRCGTQLRHGSPGPLTPQHRPERPEPAGCRRVDSRSGRYRSLAALPVAHQSDTFPGKSVSASKNPTPFPVPIADQTEGHDHGGTEHFVRRFARAAPLPTHSLHATRRNEAGESPDGQSRPLTPTQLSSNPASRCDCWNSCVHAEMLPSRQPSEWVAWRREVAIGHESVKPSARTLEPGNQRAGLLRKIPGIFLPQLRQVPELPARWECEIVGISSTAAAATARVARALCPE